MREIQTALAMRTSPDTVWDILLDFDRYPDWNPHFIEITGTPRVGDVLAVRLRTSNGSDRALDCTITHLEPYRELRWAWCMGSSWVYCGQHSFVIEPLFNDRVRFVNGESFGGLLAPVIARVSNARLRQAFEAMDRALKARAEA